jgi:hypothetical protein
MAEAPRIDRGVCYALFAYEVGHAIDLDECERRVTALTQRVNLRHKRRAPRYFAYRPAPLRVTQEAEPLAVGAYQTAPSVDVLLFDFGAVSVTYTIPFAGALGDLLGLSDALYDHAGLLADARRRVAQLVADVHPAVTRPGLADFVEPYAIFQIEAFTEPCAPAELYTTHGHALAQILLSEQGALSAQEVSDALSCRIAFGPEDLAVIGWDAALLVDRDGDDVRDVLEFANVELLEMRYLDQQLDDALTESYEALSRRTWAGRLPRPSARADLRRIGQLQVDGAILFEGVNNALKLLGEQYLARVYRLTSQRFHLAEWDGSILRKLQTLESIYQKMSDQAATWRLEVLEVIVVVLIVIEIVLPFLVSGWGH